MLLQLKYEILFTVDQKRLSKKYRIQQKNQAKKPTYLLYVY